MILILVLRKKMTPLKKKSQASVPFYLHVKLSAAFPPRLLLCGEDALADTSNKFDETQPPTPQACSGCADTVTKLRSSLTQPTWFGPWEPVVCPAV